MTEFTGFFKSTENEGLFIGSVKGEGFEILCETRNPDAAEACLRKAFPAAKAEPPKFEPAKEDIETLPRNDDSDEEELI